MSTPYWITRAGAWVGIGASPAALILGAQLGDRHDSPLALLAIVVAAAGMVGVLVWQGRLGVRPPVGEGVTFGDLAHRYFDRRAARLISVVLAAAMIGWMGFNAGLGGAALAELSGMPQAATSTTLLSAVCLLALAGLRWWNWLALAASAVSIGLIVAVVVSLDVSSSPVVLSVPTPQRLLTDVTALMGYVAVFALRSPDFTAGVARTSDVVWLAGLMVSITIAVAAAGVAVWATSGDADVITVIAEKFSAGNALLLLAVVPAMLTSFHSGRLALSAGTGLEPRRAAVVVALAGLVLGVLRFDRHLVVWLGALSVVLVPIMVPLAVEVRSRRRGGVARTVGTWTWAPASAIGAAGVVAGWHLALAAAVLLAGVLTLAATSCARSPDDVRQ